MISSEKQMLRSRIANTLNALGRTEREEKSRVIAAHLRNRLGDMVVVFGFAPMPLEPNWTAAIGAKWKVALPRVEGATLGFYWISDFTELERGMLGVREPRLDQKMRVDEAEVILVPGVVFDRRGARIGRGKGFYDRYLENSALAARRIAVCFSCQLVDRAPVEPHDAKVDAIVTEDGWIEVHSSACDRD